MLKIFKKKSVETTEQTKVPGHIAFICDGNRRWAKERHLPPLEGHRAGISHFEDLVDWFIAKGVSTVSFFIFSTENWDRSKEEVDFLMSLFYNEMKKNLKHAIKKNLRYKIIGSRERLPKKLADMCDKLEIESSENTGGTVVFALNYGGRDEIIRAVRDYGEDFELYMDTADIPDIDMLVRTSNEHRISNFMLWRAAYAELYFMQAHWPELVRSEKLYQDVLDEYSRRNRRFGGGVEKDYSGKKKK
jgi:undecaprenyl diphosphate synthase